MRFLSLFTGIGLHDLGLTRAGIQIVGQCEIDPYCCAVLEKHWPDLPRWNDVKHVSAESIRGRCGRIDGITAGFPCQDVSSAGKGAGLGTEESPTEKSGLWWELFRIVREVRPEFLLFENVPALRTRGADTVFACLEQEGYSIRPVVVGAWQAGAPHKRDRVWIVGRLVNPERGGIRLRGCPETSGSSRGVQGIEEERQRIWIDPRTADCVAELANTDSGDAQSGSRIGRILPAPDAGCKYQDSRGSSSDDELANATRDGQLEQPATERADRERIRESCDPRHGVGLADSTGERSSRSREHAIGASTLHALPSSSGGSGNMANAASIGERESANEADPIPIGGRTRDEFSDRSIPELRWPARPGQPQHYWEAPRLIELRMGEPTTGCPAELVPVIARHLDLSDQEAQAWYIRNKVRLDRIQNKYALKALGNANPWVIPCLIGQFLMAQKTTLDTP